MIHVLVVEDSRTQALQIQLLLEEAGFAVSLAANGRAALTALGGTDAPAAEAAGAMFPDVVLTDLEMPLVNGLELVEAVRRDHPALPVVLMTAVGSEEITVKALQHGAVYRRVLLLCAAGEEITVKALQHAPPSYVPKKNLAQDIGPTLSNVVDIAQASRNQQRLLECLTKTEVHFVLGNDPALVPTLIGHLQGQVAGLHRSDRTERMRTGVALHEALVNAIYHGNLEVSSNLRQEDERAFHDLAEKRRQQAPYAGRRVHVRACLGRGEAVYVVQDEGPGFDPGSLPDPTDPANLGRIGGRGLMLIRTFMDHVAHNPRGNEITMIKRQGNCRSMKQEG